LTRLRSADEGRESVAERGEKRLAKRSRSETPPLVRRRKRAAAAVQRNSDRDEHAVCVEERAWSSGREGRPKARGTSKPRVGHDGQPSFHPSKSIFSSGLGLFPSGLGGGGNPRPTFCAHFAPLSGGIRLGALYFSPPCASRSSHSGSACRRHPATLFIGNFGRRCPPKDGRKLVLKLFDLFLNGNGLAELRGAQTVEGCHKRISRKAWPGSGQ